MDIEGVDVVVKAKALAVASGVVLESACGAHEITRRVAWLLRGLGWGLLSKPNGENCHGRSIDVIVNKDGRWVDVIQSSQTDNIPSWQESPTPIDDINRWIAPEDPVDVPVPSPAPVPLPPMPTPVVQVVDFTARIDAIGDRLTAIENRLTIIDAHINQANTTIQQYMPLIQSLLPLLGGLIK